MKQDVLKFNFKFKSNEFFVTKKNFFAYNLIKEWPNWNNQLVYIYGPEKCGKTLISEIWKDSSNAIHVSEDNFTNIMHDDIDFNFVRKNNWIIDDVDILIEKNKSSYEGKILNLINILKINTDSFLLMTGKKNPKQIDCKLDDLISRISASLVVEVGFPDQDLLCKIIEKYLNDRNIVLSEKCLSYISDRIERSYKSALYIAKEIDLKSLENQSKITTHFLRTLF
jgi:chromosomal replication initiation ATPase DnaA